MMKGAGGLAASWSAPARVPPRTDPIETKLETKLNESTEAASPATSSYGSQRRMKRETSLIQSLKHMGEGGHEAVSCVSDCRFGDVRHSWRECLDKCVSNHLLRSTLLTMLPAEHHDHHSADTELPSELKVSMMRSSEL